MVVVLLLLVLVWQCVMVLAWVIKVWMGCFRYYVVVDMLRSVMNLAGLS